MKKMKMKINQERSDPVSTARDQTSVIYERKINTFFTG